MDKITGNTYQTDNYEQFQRLEGNRPVLAQRVMKIKASISRNGYIFNPIVVNEKMQIVDGQGRYEALKDLGLPVDYVVSPGSGLEQCIALNASGTIWAMSDYIDSYCELKNENYIRLKDLIAEYPGIKLQTKIMLITGLSSVPNDAIKRGSLTLSKDQEEVARKDLAFASRFIHILSRVKGVTVHYYYALVFANHCGADKSRLEDVMEKADLPPAPNLKSALNTISDLYNKNLRNGKKKLYLYALYEESMSSKYGWYGAKWGSKNSATV